MVHHNNTHQDFPDFGPGIRVIRRIPKDEYEKSVEEPFPDFGPGIRVIRRIPKDEYETSPQHPEITQSEAFWNSLKHGFSFNLDDEIAGITAAGRDSDDELAIKAFGKGLIKYWLGNKQTREKYEKEANRIRDYQRRVSDAHPWTSFAGNILGSVIPSFATLGTGALASVARFVAPTLTNTIGGSKVGRALLAGGQFASPFLGITKKTTVPHLLKVGAASGALHGAGEGEGLGNTLQTTAFGGTLGAGGALAGSLVGSMFGSAGGGIRRLFSPSHTKEGVATDTLREISKYLGKEASEELGKSFQKVVPTDFVADHSPFLQDLVFDIAKRNQGAYLDLIKRAQERALGGGKNIQGAIDNNFTKKVDSGDLLEDLFQKRKKTADANYPIAKNKLIKRGYYKDINELMHRPSFAKAYDGGLKRSFDQKEKLTKLHSSDFSKLQHKPTINLLHNIKLELDKMRNNAIKNGKSDEAYNLESIKKDLLDLMHKISPHYDKARKIYHKDSLDIDAVKEARKILSRKYDKYTVINRFEKLNEQQKLAYQAAATRELHKRINQSTDKVSKAKEIFDTGDLYDRFAKIYGTDKTSAVKNVVDKQANYIDFYNRIPGNQLIGEESFTYKPRIPTNTNDVAIEAAQIATRSAAIPFKKAASRERQRIEKDIVKLLTGGTKIPKKANKPDIDENIYSNDQIIKLIQRMVKAHHNGYVTKEWVKKRFSDLFRLSGNEVVRMFNR